MTIEAGPSMREGGALPEVLNAPGEPTPVSSPC